MVQLSVTTLLKLVAVLEYLCHWHVTCSSNFSSQKAMVPEWTRTSNAQPTRLSSQMISAFPSTLESSSSHDQTITQSPEVDMYMPLPSKTWSSTTSSRSTAQVIISHTFSLNSSYEPTSDLSTSMTMSIESGSGSEELSSLLGEMTYLSPSDTSTSIVPSLSTLKIGSLSTMISSRASSNIVSSGIPSTSQTISTDPPPSFSSVELSLSSLIETFGLTNVRSSSLLTSSLSLMAITSYESTLLTSTSPSPSASTVFASVSPPNTMSGELRTISSTLLTNSPVTMSTDHSSVSQTSIPIQPSNVSLLSSTISSVSPSIISSEPLIVKSTSSPIEQNTSIGTMPITYSSPSQTSIPIQSKISNASTTHIVSGESTADSTVSQTYSFQLASLNGTLTTSIKTSLSSSFPTMTLSVSPPDTLSSSSLIKSSTVSTEQSGMSFSLLSETTRFTESSITGLTKTPKLSSSTTHTVNGSTIVSTFLQTSLTTSLSTSINTSLFPSSVSPSHTIPSIRSSTVSTERSRTNFSLLPETSLFAEPSLSSSTKTDQPSSSISGSSQSTVGPTASITSGLLPTPSYGTATSSSTSTESFLSLFSLMLNSSVVPSTTMSSSSLTMNSSVVASTMMLSTMSNVISTDQSVTRSRGASRLSPSQQSVSLEPTMSSLSRAKTLTSISHTNTSGGGSAANVVPFWVVVIMCLIFTIILSLAVILVFIIYSRWRNKREVRLNIHANNNPLNNIPQIKLSTDNADGGESQELQLYNSSDLLIKNKKTTNSNDSLEPKGSKVGLWWNKGSSKPACSQASIGTSTLKRNQQLILPHVQVELRTGGEPDIDSRPSSIFTPLDSANVTAINSRPGSILQTKPVDSEDVTPMNSRPGSIFKPANVDMSDSTPMNSRPSSRADAKAMDNRPTFSSRADAKAMDNRPTFTSRSDAKAVDNRPTFSSRADAKAMDNRPTFSSRADANTMDNRPSSKFMSVDIAEAESFSPFRDSDIRVMLEKMLRRTS